MLIRGVATQGPHDPTFPTSRFYISIQCLIFIFYAKKNHVILYFKQISTKRSVIICKFVLLIVVVNDTHLQSSTNIDGYRTVHKKCYTELFQE